MSLLELRNQLDALDQQLFDLIDKRQRTIARIGEIKRGMGKPLRDFSREKEVLALAEANAVARGLDPALAHEMMKLLIQHSLTSQENKHLRAQAQGEGRRALVIGGAGQMGRWFARFLDSQGFVVELVDPAIDTAQTESPDGFSHRPQLNPGVIDHELIVIAAGIKTSNQVMLELAKMKPAGVVLDLASIKAPLAEGIAALQSAGIAVASLHPLFGPSAVLLADRHVVVMDLGNARATAMARQLFAETTAEVVEMSLEDHDRLMAEVLGLSHALNIVFAAALAEGGQDEGRLDRISSATFNAQTRVTRAVVHENPNLYHEIQSLNPYNTAALERLRTSLDQLCNALKSDDRDAFAALMHKGRRQLGSR